MPRTPVRSRPPLTRGTPGGSRPDPAAEFFTGLAAPGRLATFEGQSASLRFDVTHDGISGLRHWHVTVTDGAVTVSRARAAADAVIRIDSTALNALVTGRLNAQAAILRGLLTCSGSIAALVMFQRCLPSPPGSTGRVAPISSQAVMAQRRPA
jgi:hypothetical protein